jgi:hypothetical protein
MQVSSQSPPTAATKRRTSKSKEPAIAPEQMDSFTKETRSEQEANLLAEHKAQLETQSRLHQERVAAMWAQLHTQLFALWNEVWMQRQKVHDDAFKNWLKLLVA